MNKLRQLPGRHRSKAAGFATLAKRWRKRKGYSMAEAARALEIPYITWQSWEYGKREPRGLARRLILKQFRPR